MLFPFSPFFLLCFCCRLLYQHSILWTNNLIQFLGSQWGNPKVLTEFSVSRPNPRLVQALQPQLRNSLPGCYSKQCLIIWGVSANIPLLYPTTTSEYALFSLWLLFPSRLFLYFLSDVEQKEVPLYQNYRRHWMSDYILCMLMIWKKHFVLSLNKYSILVIIWNMQRSMSGSSVRQNQICSHNNFESHHHTHTAWFHIYSTFTSLWDATASCMNRVELIQNSHMACSFLSSIGT